MSTNEHFSAGLQLKGGQSESHLTKAKMSKANFADELSRNSSANCSNAIKRTAPASCLGVQCCRGADNDSSRYMLMVKRSVDL